MTQFTKTAALFLLLAVLQIQLASASFLGIGGNKSASNDPVKKSGNNSLSDNRPDAAISLLSAFQGSCSSQGSQTANADGQINSFISIIETLKATDACKPFINNLTQMTTTANQFQSLQSSSSYSTYNTDQQALSIQTLALQAMDPSSAEAQQLQTAIQNTRQQMYTDEAAYQSSQQTTKSNLIASQSQALLNWGQQLVASSQSSSPTFDQCLKQSPAAVIEMGSNLLAVGGSFLPPVIGSAVTAVAQLISMGTEMFREGQYDKPVYSAEADEMPDALNCAMESLSDSWCTADDSVQLLDLARDNRDSNYISSPLWMGIDILGRQLPGLVAWLQEVQNGVAPQTPAQAQTEAGVIEEEATVQLTDIETVGTLNYAILQYDGTADTATKNAILTSNIASLALTLSGTPVNGTTNTGLFSNLQPSPYIWACYFVSGYAKISEIPADCPSPNGVNPNGLPATVLILSQYINSIAPNGFDGIVGNLVTNWRSVKAVAQSGADSDYARVINTDAGSLIPGAAESVDGFPVHPLDVLNNISKFIDQMMARKYSADSQLPAQLVIEKAKVVQAIQDLTAPDSAVCTAASAQSHPVTILPPIVSSNAPNTHDLPSPTPSPSPSQISPAACQTQRLVDIFMLFGLQNGTQVFTTDIQNLVSFDLQNQFSAANFPPNVQDILKAAGEDFSIRLQQSGQDNYIPLTNDLGGAKADYETSIRQFRNYFIKAFNQAVQHESVLTQGEDQTQGPDRPHGQKLAQLCMFWLETANIPGSSTSSITNWPGTDTQQICEKTVYYNGNDAPDASGKFTPAFVISDLEKSIGSLPFEKRVCTFHHFKTHNEAKTYYVGQ